jgi:hypothetical protein
MPSKNNVVEISRRHKMPPDWTGQVFGRLTVVDFSGVDRHGQRMWLCKCSCGNETVRPAGTLKSGNTKSCGCFHDEVRRGKKGTKLPQLSAGYGIAAKNAVIGRYKARAKKLGRIWSLSTEQAEAIFRSDCHYCGKEPSHRSANSKLNGDYVYSGIDRIDNYGGYEPGNVVPCCRRCNMAKNDMPYDEFLEWIERVYLNFIKNPKRAYAN